MKKRINAVSPKAANRRLKELDKALFTVGKNVEIIARLRWSPKHRKAFLKNWNQRNPSLPQVTYSQIKLGKQKEELKSIINSVDNKHPIGKIIQETAQHYYIGVRMIECRGKNSFLTYSKRLFGEPRDACFAGGGSTLKAATQFLKGLKKFHLAEILPKEEDVCLLPEHVAARIQQYANKRFDEKISVLIDPKLSAKAISSVKTIKVRSSTCFAEQDIGQLIQHELMVHSLTIINGRKQKFKVFGLNSPRTTCTQEGLAVFSEFITGVIDIKRLLRISTRVKAIQMALDGADFIQVFKFFLDVARQSPAEAFNSAARIFRGGKVSGGVVFTKDQSYLKGFVEVHRFFLHALQNEQYLYPVYLFAGRMQAADVPLVSELIGNGLLKEPHYQPDWVRNRSTLLAFLLSSSVMNSLGLNKR